MGRAFVRWLTYYFGLLALYKRFKHTEALCDLTDGRP